MAKQPKKINEVISLLGEGKSSKEIMEQTGCSAPTVSVARKRLRERESDINTATEDINTDVDENVDSFIKSIKITPDPEVLTEGKDSEDDSTDYECPECGHGWDAPKNERQERCPECGLEFE